MPNPIEVITCPHVRDNPESNPKTAWKFQLEGVNFFCCNHCEQVILGSIFTVVSYDILSEMLKIPVSELVKTVGKSIK